MAISNVVSPLAFLVFAAIIASSLQTQEMKIDECEYEMVVSTGQSGGPSSMKLKVYIEAIGGRNINTTNLIKKWGAMGPNHIYFSPHSYDKFRTRLPCVPANFCYIHIGGKKGELKPHWFLNNITVTTIGNGINRYKSFNFFGDDGEVKTLYPYVNAGECP